MGRVFITGGTGFIGLELVRALLERGDRPVVLTRDADNAASDLAERVEVIEGDPTLAGEWQASIAGADAVVNLAGYPLAARRWDARIKQLIHDSRVETTRYLVEGIEALPENARPKVLVSGSGIDYYPFSIDLGAGTDWDDEDEIDESTPSSESFMGRVCRNWEAEAYRAASLGLRVVTLRTGIVLDRGDGALDKMTTPFKLFAGGRIGSGNQWMSWIHRGDHVRVILFALDTDDLSGPVNAVAPEPVRNRDFAKGLGKAMGRPAWLPVPAFAVKLATGELAEYVLNGRRAVPRKLREAGFEFRYPDIASALGEIFGS